MSEWYTDAPLLTEANYHSQEANEYYFSHSQYLDFCKCEAMTMAKLRGEYVPETSTAFLVGSYVDAHFEGTLDLWIAQHPECMKRDGTLKSEYQRANEMIQRVERDEYFMKLMSGSKQKILTADWLGVPWKIKMDSYRPDEWQIVDLKSSKDLDSVYVPGQGRIPFVEAYGYGVQGTIYTRVEQAVTGRDHPLDFILAVVTKEVVPDIEALEITQTDLETEAKIIEQRLPHIIDVKMGIVEPVRCGVCDYCKQTKVLTGARDYREVLL